MYCKSDDYESSDFYKLSNWEVVKNHKVKPHCPDMWNTEPTQTLLKRTNDDSISCRVLIELFHSKVLRADVNDQSVRIRG